MTEFPYAQNGDAVRIELPMELIVRNRSELKSIVLGLLEGDARTFVLDFGATERVDSSGLGVLVSIAKRIRDEGGDLRLANMNDALWDVFRATRLDLLFERDDSADGGSVRTATPVVPPRPSAMHAEQDRERRGESGLGR